MAITPSTRPTEALANAETLLAAEQSALWREEVEAEIARIEAFEREGRARLQSATDEKVRNHIGGLLAQLASARQRLRAALDGDWAAPHVPSIQRMQQAQQPVTTQQGGWTRTLLVVFACVIGIGVVGAISLAQLRARPAPAILRTPVYTPRPSADPSATTPTEIVAMRDKLTEDQWLTYSTETIKGKKATRWMGEVVDVLVGYTDEREIIVRFETDDAQYLYADVWMPASFAAKLQKRQSVYVTGSIKGLLITSGTVAAAFETASVETS